ncbi:glutamate 5-kinase [Planctopirus limnophila DSM 3776]|uniref:Glutamate 5-kinase n=1 Tax=Planctopirus limnophila (strain ATCC 43296 / DSM 3776 / IFAM 1008 / Mu 290) TaxID=521674 RepID=D5SW86_PLAL2|nr:glutamate 5-kinase [Planctopirus limnophila]ADG67371.1 glutamate 5-kinase [Planctopirus limnophila DSM 3776]
MVDILAAVTQPVSQERMVWLKGVRSVVVKVGTNVLSDANDQLDDQRIAHLASQLHGIVASGRKVVLVSSGAIGAGMSLLGLKTRPKDLPHLQAAAATGQAHLIETYDRHFRRFGFHAAQLLLTANDFKNRSRYLNVRNTLLTLGEYNTIPIVNENDTVSTQEIKLGDNDRLAAMVANLIPADLLIVLSVVDGLLTGDPSSPESRRIPIVERFDEDLLSLVGASKSSRGTGGMRSKLESVRTATAVGTHVVIAHGKCDGVIESILEGKDVGTFFAAEQQAIPAWKRWIGFTLPPKGRLQLDAGARNAVEHLGRSLLAIGVVGVEGDFEKGEVVSLVDSEGEEFARGLVNYDAVSARAVAGKKREEMAKILGEIPYDEVIHRDNLVVTSIPTGQA